jgi:sarcosine oxidase gamma subunit
MCYSWPFAGVASDAPSVCRDRSGRKLKTGLRSQPAEYRRLYPILPGQTKAESGVITRITKNPDEWLVQGLGGAKYGMHERSAHAESLLIGIHRQRSKRQHRCRIDTTTGAQDMTRYVAFGIHSYK